MRLRRLGKSNEMSGDFFQRSLAGSASVTARSNRTALALIGVTASCTTPRELTQRTNRFRQVMVNGDAQAPSIHFPHLPAEVTSMIRPSPEHVKLPLMDHLVGEGAQDLRLELTVKQWE